MAKGTVDQDKSTEVWSEIDSTNINVAGRRCFYNDPDGGKKTALVTGVTGRRDGQGRRLDVLTVFPKVAADSIKVIEAPLSDDRTAGTYALANDGDLVEPQEVKPHTEQPPVEVEVPSDSNPGTPSGNAPSAHGVVLGDLDGDGDVDRDDKRLRKHPKQV
jgi:hypothetical protein